MSFYVYATERGYTRGLAEYVFAQLGAHSESRLMPVEQLLPAMVQEITTLVYFTSTFYSGQHPRAAYPLLKFLAEGNPKLEHIRFQVVGVGSSAYAYTYQRAAIEITYVLSSRGAKKISAPLLMDRKRLDLQQMVEKAVDFLRNLLHSAAYIRASEE